MVQIWWEGPSEEREYIPLEGIGICSGGVFLTHKIAMDLFQMVLESESHHPFTLSLFFSSPFFGLTLFFFFFFNFFHWTLRSLTFGLSSLQI